MAETWLRPLRKNSLGESKVSLVCFHHAGGSALAYRDWGTYLPPEIEPYAVQLPGRADRLGEPAVTDQGELLDTLMPVIDTLPEPYAFYGLSMGAILAWSLACRLYTLGKAGPSMLFVANAAPPNDQQARRSVATWTDDDLVGFIRSMGATPDALFEDSSFMDYLLATLRADLQLIDDQRYADVPRLQCPIYGFAGTDDVDHAVEHMPMWKDRTREPFDLTVLESGHFFDEEATRVVTGVIAEQLASLAESGTR